ncbi:MAG TPA: RNA 2',3'-cyclic phosphodiesterase [Gemmatimonadales bacterium]|jgi:2'-5' RNA ligase|nr:RNA 2',3'-cyclic phosphodiesterase [Gemmatimonadales bacterium]
MRLFVALPITEPARGVIAGLLDRLRSSDWPVRWVRPEGIHLTLKFYGEVAPERLEVIEEAIRFAAAGTGPIPMRLSTLGAFPTTSRPRILWLGLEAPPAVELLQHRLEQSGEAIGFPPEGAPFQPHVTLGRMREGHRLPHGWTEHADGAAERVAFLADQVVLYESVLTGDGPRYEARLILPLQT